MFNGNNKTTIMLKPARALFWGLLLAGWCPLLTGQNLELWEIQGSGNTSPLVGQLVTTANNVVTAVGPDFFFAQTPPQRSDNDPLTSDGIFVYTGSFPTVSVGQLVNISGIVKEFAGQTEFSGNDLHVTPTGNTAVLPPAVVFTADFPSGSPGLVRDLERVEGMLVSFVAAVVGPDQGDGLAALALTPNRPFREAGISYPGQNGLPVWDDNPEVFWLATDALGQPANRFFSYGQTVTSTAVLFQSDNIYLAFAKNYTTTGTVSERNLRARAADEITIGSINVLQLREDNEALALQLPKVARYIVDRLGAPDIIALQEVGNLGVLQQLNIFINQRNPALNYVSYLIQGNNNTPINSAYLVSTRIRDVQVRLLGAAEKLSNGGRLHDRPPLLLEANLPTNPPTPIRVLNLHLRSLGGIEDPNSSNFVRAKRHQQSISVAEMIQDRQDENLFIIGDFNALPYSDGYVDVLSQIAGRESLGAQLPVDPIVNPTLIDYAYTPADTESYSYVFQGSAQLLDHCLSTQLQDLAVNELAFARGNADAATAYFANPNIPTRSSDHDGFVLYLRPAFPLVSRAQEATTPGATWAIPNPVNSGTTIQLPPGFSPDRCVLRDAQGRLVQEWSGAAGSLTLPHVNSGMYGLQWLAHGVWRVQRLVILP